MFGNAINHDSHFLTEPTKENSLQTYHDRIDKLYRAQERLIAIAQKNQLDLDTFHIAKRDAGNDKIKSFPINLYVLAEYEDKKASKYHTNLHGPYRVIAVNGAVYTLENLITHAYTDFHIKLLREFRYEPEHTNPEDVARHDKEYDGITTILSHRFTNKRKAKQDLEFQLVWARKPTPVWERWNATLAANETVHDYLRANQLRRMIPTKYTWPIDHPEYIAPVKRKAADNAGETLPAKKRRRKRSNY